MSRNAYFSSEQERSLIRSAKSGCTKARDRLVLRALPFVKQAIRNRYPGAEEQDLEDLLHDSVPVLIDSIDRYDLDHPSRARLYVFAMSAIHNALLRQFRQREHLIYLEEPPDHSDGKDLDGEVLVEELVRLVRSCLSHLTDKDRDLLLSRLAKDRPTSRRELALRYDCPPHVIEYAEQRAVDRLLHQLGQAHPGFSPNSIH